MWSAKPSLPSGTPPAPTTTEEITSKREWMCTCGSGCRMYVHTYIIHCVCQIQHSCRNVTVVHTTSSCTAVTAGGLPVSANEVHATAESLPDEAVDAELRHLRTCFSEVVWVLVTSICKLVHGYHYCLHYQCSSV